MANASATAKQSSTTIKVGQQVSWKTAGKNGQVVQGMVIARRSENGEWKFKNKGEQKQLSEAKKRQLHYSSGQDNMPAKGSYITRLQDGEDTEYYSPRSFTS